MIGLDSFRKKSDFDSLITQLTERLATTDPGSEEYTKLMTHLERLTKMRGSDTPRRLSRDTMLIVFGNLVGIVIVVFAEDSRVITSKAFGMIPKLKTDKDA